ncbi:thiamine phosphate synthase [Litoribacter ruber]|uniref:thiamine phosphate synthase n=1 Tax=Litoribacter ruber TaxID=702568 RepID=UPI001BDB5149|nr:thiamine phosphate synthase [Litoribacter ruber]MBT0810128.1 thiamine phosphate synthase [Litoribacter ruber]
MERLQFISHGHTAEEQLEGIKLVLDAGCKWVQFRWKSASLNKILKIGTEVKSLTEAYGAKLLINDHVKAAQELDADGLHLGLDDGSIPEARKILGVKKIIGGTANTLKHVQQRLDEGVDYVGLGPLRFTVTKEKLSPILGFEGYTDICSKLTSGQVPIYAIGGVNAEDIPQLLECGVYGVAVSSALLDDPNSSIKNFNRKLYEAAKNSR